MIEITVETLKKALNDHTFRKMYPELNQEIDKYLGNPSCACNRPLYQALMADTKKLEKYFGDKVVVMQLAQEEPEQVNQW